MIPFEGRRPVSRIENATADTVQALARENRPAVLAGIGSSWPALRLWSPAYLVERVGPRVVRPEGHASARFFDAWMKFGPRMDPMTVADAVARIVAPPDERRFYLGTPMEAVSELTDDYTAPPALPAPTQQALIFGGPADSPLHYHPNTQVVLCMVSGRKRVALYRPGACRTFYTKPILDSYMHLSNVNFDEDIAVRYPRFRSVVPDHVVEIEPGDGLFIPVHWWHVVATPALAAAVQFAWGAGLREWVFPQPGIRSITANLLDMAGVRGNYEIARHYARKLKRRILRSDAEEAS